MLTGATSERAEIHAFTLRVSDRSQGARVKHPFGALASSAYRTTIQYGASQATGCPDVWTIVRIEIVENAGMSASAGASF